MFLHKKRALLLIIVLTLTSLSASASPFRSERGTITCKTELRFEHGKGGKHTLKGPRLTSMLYAAWDETVPQDNYGDIVFFHANGLVTPNIQPEFFVGIEYRVDERIKQGFREPLEVLMKVYDNRIDGSGGLEQLVAFDAGQEFSLSLKIVNQDKLWYEKRNADDQLTSVTLTCVRKAY
jgi:hypothetical protein